ncbi:DUF6153 family protein [Streptomyces sp. NPDC089799]|uniref:DUF6153 family protein n=1 Tax=Streptomyces sp. NPDC089799 TaxID=3155066 RepID=UPI00342F0DB9
MISAVPPPSRRKAGYGFALLVLVVLAGVLGMHGLAPGAAFTGSLKTAAAVADHGAGSHGAADRRTGDRMTAGRMTADRMNAGPMAADSRTADGRADGGHGTAGHGAAAASHPSAGDCSHTAGGTGHANGHADAMCTAAGVVTAYAPPAPAPGLATEPAPAPFLSGGAATRASGRAPPDLSELQLLRI